MRPMRRTSCRIPPAAKLPITLVVLVLVLATSAVSADVYTYECDVLPRPAGWILSQGWCGCPPEPCEGTQWIEDGKLFQQNGLCEGVEGANFVSHFRPIEEHSTTGGWFAEWRMVTDGISEELLFVAPASVVVWDANAMLYHFTIADDQVRFVRDFDFPVLYFDIGPGTHTYRLELYGKDLDETYLVYIDGQLQDSGAPEGPLFNPVTGNAQVNFRSKAVLVPSTAIWSYFRWGDLQVDGGGDFTEDGEVDFDDLPYFQECLTTDAGAWPGCAWADMDFSGGVNCDDWALFLEAWTDPADPPGMPQCANPPDFDGDGSVGPFDLAILLGSWGPCPDPPADCPADLDGDGFVNAFDLAMLLGSWG